MGFNEGVREGRSKWEGEGGERERSWEEEKGERQMEAGKREKERLTIARRQVARSPLAADKVNFS